MIFRRLFCYFNIHYHPEKDGFYLEETENFEGSHGRCYACGTFIKKTCNGWIKA